MVCKRSVFYNDLVSMFRLRKPSKNCISHNHLETVYGSLLSEVGVGCYCPRCRVHVDSLRIDQCTKVIYKNSIRRF